MNTISEPVLTWNLFLTLFLAPLSVSLLYFGIKNMFKKQSEAKEKDAVLIKELLIEHDKLKEDTIRERWDRFAKVQCEIKSKVESIEKSIPDKVSWAKCDEWMNKLDERIRKVGG